MLNLLKETAPFGAVSAFKKRKYVDLRAYIGISFNEGLD